MTAAPHDRTESRSTPRRLDAAETVWQVGLLAFRRSFRGSRFWIAVALVAFPLAVSIPVGANADARDQEEAFYGFLAFYHFGLAVPVVALSLATAFPWPEAEEGTLTWWFTSPVRRWAIHLGRYAAALTFGSLVLPLSIVALAVPLDAGDAAELGSVAWTAVAATLLVYPAYLALFWLVSTWFRRGLAAGVLYIVLENTLSLVQGNLASLTMIRYVRSTVHPAVPEGSRGAAEAFLLHTEPAAAATCVAVFLCVAAGALVLSLLLVEGVEYRGRSDRSP